MGLSSNKTTSKTSQTQTGSTTPVAPDWLLNSTRGYNDRIDALSAQDPHTFVAGPSALQTQAFDAASHLGGWQPGNTAATTMAGSVAGAGPNLTGPTVTGASQMGAYQNPWDQKVVDTTLAGFDQNAGQARAAQAAAGARNGAFGGSRFGIAEGQLGGDLALGRGQLEAGLRQAGFNTAAGYGMQDAAAMNRTGEFNANQRDTDLARQLQAAALTGDLANNAGANERSDVATQLGAGDTQHQLEQAYAQAPWAQILAEGQARGLTPYQILVGQDVNGTMSGTNVTKSSPSLFQMLMGGASAAAQAYASGMGGA